MNVPIEIIGIERIRRMSDEDRQCVCLYVIAANRNDGLIKCPNCSRVYDADSEGRDIERMSWFSLQRMEPPKKK